MKMFYQAVRFMTMMTFSCILAVFVGMWLDAKLNTTPWIFLLLLSYAIGGSIYQLVKGMNQDA